ncbi:MAG: hypothetical protein IPK67_06335 [Planctomycetes bacterium]|nr:hypothetical protein [Planctomycetota bacterium]
MGLLLTVAAGCAEESAEPVPLQLLDLRPRERSSVYLNEPLVLHFSSELDRASVTPQSFSITTRSGSPARGSRFVAGRELSFVPDPVLSPDLSDGGFVPNTTYVVELAGFPRADALRSESGACLSRTLRIEFRTVAVSEPRTGFIFDDASPDHAKPLHVLMALGAKVAPNRTRMYSETGLQLEGEEPIDPSTLGTGAFALVRDLPGGGRSEHPLRPVLRSNHNKHAFPYQGTTILRLVPLTRVPEGDGYRLSVDPSRPALRDFSGHPVPVIGKESLSQLTISVLAGRAEDSAGEYLEEFLDTAMRSSLLVPGADGTALWSNTGRLEVRYPASAGDGSDGDVEFGPDERRSALAAARFRVPAGVASTLDAGDGVCVLACQGAIDIEGDLRRVGEVDQLPFPEVRPGETVTGWLARQGSLGRPVTVIVAGGDLRIRGELSVPGPLLLVAGGRVLLSPGRIRVGGAEPVGVSHLGDLAERGSLALWAAREGNRALTRVAPAALKVDAPLVNPLVRPLVYAVRSNPVPSEGRAVRWLPADSTRGRHGAGEFRIRYAGERLGAETSPFESPNPPDPPPVEVDDPTLLLESPSLRLVLTLSVPAGPRSPSLAPWDPPSIDSVRVRWESR